MNFDVTALGELLIDFTESGISANGQRLFEQNPGGAPANLLVALRRLGNSTAFLGKVGDDMHGRFLTDTLLCEGVETAGLIADESAFTTLAFVALGENGARTFSFARRPGADTCLTPGEINTDILAQSRIFHVGSLSLTDEPARSATLVALEQAKQAGCIISYDPNYRAPLWRDKAEAVRQMRRVLPFVDLMKLSDEETALLTDEADPEAAAALLLAQGVAVVAVTLGGKGAYIRTAAGGRFVPGFAVPAVDTTGAGDCFWGAFLHRFLETATAPEALSCAQAADCARFANAAAALCVQRRGGIPAMPVPAEVEALLNTHQ